MSFRPLSGHWIVNAMSLEPGLQHRDESPWSACGRRLAGAWVGALSAVIVAALPELIFHSGTILTETTFNFVFVLALLVLCWRPWSGQVPSWKRLVVFGVLFGLSIEVRPIVLLVVAIAADRFWRVAGAGWRSCASRRWWGWSSS